MTSACFFLSEWPRVSVRTSRRLNDSPTQKGYRFNAFMNISGLTLTKQTDGVKFDFSQLGYKNARLCYGAPLASPEF